MKTFDEFKRSLDENAITDFFQRVSINPFSSVSRYTPVNGTIGDLYDDFGRLLHGNYGESALADDNNMVFHGPYLQEFPYIMSMMTFYGIKSPIIMIDHTLDLLKQTFLIGDIDSHSFGYEVTFTSRNTIEVKR